MIMMLGSSLVCIHFHLCSSFPINVIYLPNQHWKTLFSFYLRLSLFPGKMWNRCFPGVIALSNQWGLGRGSKPGQGQPLRVLLNQTWHIHPPQEFNEDSTESLPCFIRPIKWVFKILKFSNEIYKGWLFSSLSTSPFGGKREQTIK